MALAAKETNGVTVITLEGCLDDSNVRNFREDVAGLLAGKEKVVFDLEKLRVIKSSGMGALLCCLRQLNKSGGDLKLCAVRGQVFTLFCILRMHRIFEIYKTKEDAVASFHATQKGETE